MRDISSRHHPRKRVIQYSKGKRNQTEKPQRAGYSAFAEYGEFWNFAHPDPTTNKALNKIRTIGGLA
jgi:hypothetical protein